MPTQARSAYGTIFKIGVNTIPEVVNIDGLGSRTDLVDVSAHDGSGYSSEIATIKRNNPITVTCNYVPGNTIQNSLKAQYDAGSSTSYSVTLPGTPSAVWSFSAVVSQWQLNPLPVNSVPQLAVIFNPDGPITITTTP
jgi:hypothetical protein